MLPGFLRKLYLVKIKSGQTAHPYLPNRTPFVRGVANRAGTEHFVYRGYVEFESKGIREFLRAPNSEAFRRTGLARRGRAWYQKTKGTEPSGEVSKMSAMRSKAASGLCAMKRSPSGNPCAMRRLPASRRRGK